MREADALAGVAPETLLEMQRRMWLIRKFEESAARLVDSGELEGEVHLSIGQEGEIVGSCLALRADDYMTGNHRSHGHPIGKGADPAGLMAELMGKATGVCKGKGGSMHLADFSVGSLGESGIVASAIPVAVGAAMSAQIQGNGKTGSRLQQERRSTTPSRSPWRVPHPTCRRCSRTCTPTRSRCAAADRIRRVRQLTYLQAICEAQREEMVRDERVILLGEDIRSNLFGTAGGFLEQFGPERVRNVPMSEAAFVGAGVGAAMTGLRPIVDMLLSSFMYVAMDQFVSQVAKSRYMFGGQADLPVVYRAAMFYGNGEAAHHSDRPYPTFMTVPGLKIADPAHRTCSAASEIAATVADEAFSSLQAPIKRITTPDVNIPFTTVAVRTVIAVVGRA